MQSPSTTGQGGDEIPLDVIPLPPQAGLSQGHTGQPGSATFWTPLPHPKLSPNPSSLSAQLENPRQGTGTLELPQFLQNKLNSSPVTLAKPPQIYTNTKESNSPSPAQTN